MLYFFGKIKKKVIKLYFSNQDFFSSSQWVSVHVVRCPSLLLPSPSYLFLALGWANKQTVCPLTASQRCHLHLIPLKWGTLCVLCARRLAEQTAWLLPKDRQCKGAGDWNADTLCSSAVIKGNAGNKRPIFTSTRRLQERQRHQLNARQCSGQKNMKMWMCKLLPGIFLFWFYACDVKARLSYQPFPSLQYHRMICRALYSVPDFQQSLVNVDTLPIHQELQVWDLWAVKLLLQRLSDSQVVIAIWQLKKKLSKSQRWSKVNHQSFFWKIRPNKYWIQILRCCTYITA